MSFMSKNGKKKGILDNEESVTPSSINAENLLDLSQKNWTATTSNRKSVFV